MNVCTQKYLTPLFIQALTYLQPISLSYYKTTHFDTHVIKGDTHLGIFNEATQTKTLIGSLKYRTKSPPRIYCASNKTVIHLTSMANALQLNNSIHCPMWDISLQARIKQGIWQFLSPALMVKFLLKLPDRLHIYIVNRLSGQALKASTREAFLLLLYLFTIKRLG